MMGLARSTFYESPTRSNDDTAIVESMASICDEFEHYGWRRVRAALRQQGLVVNHKKIRRLMREHDLQPKTRRRFTATTDSNHDQPIFPNLAAEFVPAGPDQLWVADITYVAVTSGFVYVAIVLDAWSRRVVGYALSRSIDARLTLAALQSANAGRKPPPGCLHHSDRGSQYAAGAYRQYLAANGFVGSMGRRGNPYDNAKAESFMKTLKVEGVYEDQIRVNSSAAFALARACAPEMKRKGYGKIVNFCSLVLNGRWDGYVPYVASKGAMLGLTKSLARELGRHGVRVNAISPGAVVSDAERRVFGDRLAEYDSWILENQSIKRRIQPADIAELTLFLLSSRSDMISGQNLSVDGGW